MLAVVVVRCVDFEPTKAISLATPPGSSRWMSNEYYCTYGDFAVGSTMLKLCPMPVRFPRLLPAGCRIPDVNGLVRLSAGVTLPSTDALGLVVWLYPTVAIGDPMANCGAQKMP